MANLRKLVVLWQLVNYKGDSCPCRLFVSLLTSSYQLYRIEHGYRPVHSMGVHMKTISSYTKGSLGKPGPFGEYGLTAIPPKSYPMASRRIKSMLAPLLRSMIFFQAALSKASFERVFSRCTYSIYTILPSPRLTCGESSG